MFDRRFRLAASAWMLIFVAFSFVGGCSSDGDSNPIVPGPTDQAPPLTPTGIGVASHAATKVMFRWEPNTDPDLAGYRVYIFDPDPERSGAFRCVTGAALWRNASFTYAVADGTTYCFRVTAVDTNGNESAMSDPLTFSLSTPDGTLPGTTAVNDGTGRGDAKDIDGHGWFPNENAEVRGSW